VLDDRGSIPNSVNDGIIFLRHLIQTGSGAHPAFYQTDSGGSYTPFSAVENETLNPRRILRCSTASIVSENAS
jgi:hypothetical protein